MEIGFIAFGLILGFIAAWLFANAKNKSKVQELQLQNETGNNKLKSDYESTINELKLQNTKLSSEIEAQKSSLEETKKALIDTFKSAASDALTNNNKQFLDLAKSKLETQVKEAEGDLDERKAAIKEMLEPLQKSIETYKKRIEELEKGSEKTFGSVTQLMESLQKSQDDLRIETGALVTALKNPRVRGKWGEIGLKRIVEFSGMSAHCDFEEQVSTNTEEGRLRPDMIVHLPNNRHVVVDSKLPLNAYLEALETTDEAKREALFANHAKALRTHMNMLSKKEYWNQFSDTPDFVILYIEVESAFSAAMMDDRLLIQDGIKNKIIFATPTTLITILRSVAMSWEQHSITVNADKISEASVELFERLITFADNLNKVGSGLESAVKNYNKAIGSWDSRVLPSGKKLNELNDKIKKELPDNLVIETSIREPKQLN